MNLVTKCRLENAIFSSWSGTVTAFQILASSYVSMLFLPPSTFKEHPTPMFYQFIPWFLLVKFTKNVGNAFLENMNIVVQLKYMSNRPV